MFSQHILLPNSAIAPKCANFNKKYLFFIGYFFTIVILTTGRRQPKTLYQSTNADQKSLVFFDCHLSPNWRQMAIENSVSNDFLSSFVDSINVFDCRLPGVILFALIFLHHDSSSDFAEHFNKYTLQLVRCVNFVCIDALHPS